MSVEEIFIKLKDELTAENDSSSSPERIFIKNDEQTICTLGMNRSHEIIFVEFKPAPKDLIDIERQGFVHPHPVEMLHDAGWRQAQITSLEEVDKLLEIINRSYKKKKRSPEEGGRLAKLKGAKKMREVAGQKAAAKLASKKVEPPRKIAGPKLALLPKMAAKPASITKSKPVAAKPKPAAAKPKVAPKAKPKVKAVAKPKPAAKKSKPAPKKKKK